MGGGYTSLVFTKTVETNLRGGQSIINPSGEGFLRAANPRNSSVSLEVIESCVIPLVFSPVDRVFSISFEVVRDLPYTVVLGAAFMKDHPSTISFREKEGFRPTPLAYHQLGDVIERYLCCWECILCHSSNCRCPESRGSYRHHFQVFCRS